MTTNRITPCWDLILLDFQTTAIHENHFFDVTLITRFHHVNGIFWINGFFD